LKRSTLAGAVTACLYLGLAGPLLAAEPTATGPAKHLPASGQKFSAVKPAAKCTSDLRAFNGQMEKDGYWRGGSPYGHGYPMGGYYGYPMGGDGYPERGHPVAATATGYQDVRLGYEVRTLVASANILARHGQQQPCEAVLAATRGIYKQYTADLRSGGVWGAHVPDWRQQQIAAAQPVTAKNASFRSDELLGTEVRNPQDEALGSVDDIVMSPQTGKIAYLVIARGGIFGIDEKYVPVPWEDFKATASVSLLVLDATKSALDAAPQVKDDQFTSPGHFDQESGKVDAYWRAHLTTNGTIRTNG